MNWFVLAVALVATTSCLRPAQECTTDDDCFIGESCVRSACTIAIEDVEIEPPPAGPLDIDQDWEIGQLSLAVSDFAIPHLLVEEFGADRLHHITWDGARWVDDVVVEDTLSDLPSIHVVRGVDPQMHAVYIAKKTSELHVMTLDDGEWRNEVVARPDEGLIPFGADIAVLGSGEPVVCWSLVDLAQLALEEEAPIRVARRTDTGWEEMDTQAVGIPGCTLAVGLSERIRVFGSAYRDFDAFIPNLFMVEFDTLGSPEPVRTDLPMEGFFINPGAGGDNVGAPAVVYARFDGVQDELLLSTKTPDGWRTDRIEQLPEGREYLFARIHTHPEAPGLFEVTAESFAEDGTASNYVHYAVWGPRKQREELDEDGELEIDWFDLGVDINGSRHPFIYTLTAGFVYLGPT